MSLTGKRSPESMEPEDVGDGQTEQRKKQKEEEPHPPASLTEDDSDDYDSDDYDSDEPHDSDNEVVRKIRQIRSKLKAQPLWPLPSSEYALDAVVSHLQFRPFDSYKFGNIDSIAEEIVKEAVEKAENERMESHLSPEKTRDVYDMEVWTLIDKFRTVQIQWDCEKREMLSSVRTYYQNQLKEFSSTLTDYFQSPEAVKALFSEERALFQLVEQHPKLLQMLQEKKLKLQLKN